MSKENVEIVRELHAAFAEVGMEAIREALLRYDDFATTLNAVPGLGLVVEDDVEVQHAASNFSLPDLPAGTTLHGPEGWLAFWRAWLEPWEEFEFEYGNFADAGDDVVLDIAVAARGRGSGVPIHIRLSQVWTVRDGKIGRLLVFDTRVEALKAAGLSA
jgi:ketosteroid isomerase-like protein